MERVATTRLIEAAATLSAADRALLNMWLHRGLPDDALARMAGLDRGTVTARKLDIVDHLSATLGLPPYEVIAALNAITGGRTADLAVPAGAPLRPVPAEPERVPAEPPSVPADRGPVATAVPAPPPVLLSQRRPPRPPAPRAASPVPVMPPAAPAPRRRATLPPLPVVRLRRPRTLWLSGTALLLAIGAAATLLATGSVPRAGHPVASHSGSGLFRTVEIVTRRLTPAPTGLVRNLTPLPGGPVGATADMSLATKGDRATLRLRASGLPAAGGGHYEVWLYSTIIDSEALGTLRSGSWVAFPIPPGARRYRWIDVSLQPPGGSSNSGESVLRAPNPLWR